MADELKKENEESENIEEDVQEEFSCSKCENLFSRTQEEIDNGFSTDVCDDCVEDAIEDKEYSESNDEEEDEDGNKEDEEDEGEGEDDEIV